MRKKPICPLLSISDELEECMESECRFWISIFTTENRMLQMCAFEAMAQKNSDGKIVV